LYYQIERETPLYKDVRFAISHIIHELAMYLYAKKRKKEETANARRDRERGNY